jgi:hypothetical protein
VSFRTDFIANLPPNPDDALIILADRASDWLQAPRQDDDALNAAYITQIFDRFIGRYRPDIKAFIFTDPPAIKDYIEAIIKFSGTREVDRLIDSYEKTVDDADSFGIANLNAEEKERLHEHLNRLRQIIESSEIPVKKKNALFGRLNALASEIDSAGTRTDRFFAFAGDVAFVVGDMAKKAKPFIDEVKEILKIVRGSRARTEQVELPHDDTFKLPAPDLIDSVGDN